MRNIRLTIEYDGTAYHGWQSQINASTVQDVVTGAIRSLTGENCSVTGSSRTDTGVHALGFVCNFFTESAIPADKFPFALNTILPEDISVKKSEEVTPEFHARFSAIGKTYKYLIYNSTFPSALLRHRAYHVFYPLDTKAMNSAASHIVGTHDFTAFSAAGGSSKTTVRTITQAEVKVMGGIQRTNIGADACIGNIHNAGDPAGFIPTGVPLFTQNAGDGRLIEFTVTGDGFLYNMVRIIAGTLIEAGFGRLNPDSVPDILASLDRKRAGRTAPAHGLYLVGVYYDDSISIPQNGIPQVRDFKKNETADD